MQVALPHPNQTTTIALPDETGAPGVVHNYTHNNYTLLQQQPPDGNVLRHTSQHGASPSAIALNSEAIVCFCGYVVGIGLARGIQTDDVRKMTGCFSIAAVGAYALLNTTYSACKTITGCKSVCSRALKLTGLGAVAATIGFFVNYS